MRELGFDSTGLDSSQLTYMLGFLSQKEGPVALHELAATFSRTSKKNLIMCVSISKKSRKKKKKAVL